MLTLLDDVQLARVAPRLASMQRNSIRLTATLIDETLLPLGSSKLGGYPDLPPGWLWPTTALPRPSFMVPGAPRAPLSGMRLPPDDIIALPFIAQIRLGDVHPYDIERLLPSTGILYFFYNPVYYEGLPYGKPGSWHVVYHDDFTHLQRRIPPRAIPSEAIYRACAVTFTAETTLPNIETCYIGEKGDRTAKITLTPDEWEAYAELHYDMRANRSIHQMLGYADTTQPYVMEGNYSDVRATFWPDLPPFEQLTAGEQQAEWEQGRLLLQVDEQDNGMRFGRDGRLFFFIREQDLRSLNFSGVWAAET